MKRLVRPKLGYALFGVELRGQVAALTSEKKQNLISWAREKWDRDSIIGA